MPCFCSAFLYPFSRPTEVLMSSPPMCAICRRPRLIRCSVAMNPAATSSVPTKCAFNFGSRRSTRTYGVLEDNRDSNPVAVLWQEAIKSASTPRASRFSISCRSSSGSSSADARIS